MDPQWQYQASILSYVLRYSKEIPRHMPRPLNHGLNNLREFALLARVHIEKSRLSTEELDEMVKDLPEAQERAFIHICCQIDGGFCQPIFTTNNCVLNF